MNSHGDSHEPIDGEPVKIPITNELDLHTFRADEISDLLPEYFAECRKRNILSLRVIHGKGTGTLREGVHRLLERCPASTSGSGPLVNSAAAGARHGFI